MKSDMEALKQDLIDYPNAYQYESAKRLGVTYKKTLNPPKVDSVTICLVPMGMRQMDSGVTNDTIGEQRF